MSLNIFYINLSIIFMSYTIYILLFLALLSVSTSPILGRWMSPELHGVTIAFWRMTIATAILWLISTIKYIKPMSVKNRNRTILAGIFLGFHFALFFSSIQKTSIAYATFLGTLAPVFTLLIELIILKRKFNYFVIIGLTISLFGAFIISFSNTNNAFSFYTDSDNIGKVMAILCSICLAISYIIAEKVRKNENTFAYTRILYLSASIILLPIFIYIISSTQSEYLVFSNSYFYLGLIFLGIVPTLFGHNTIYYAVKYVSPTVVSAFPLGEPIIAIIIAFILTHFLGFNEFSKDIIISNNIYIGGFLSLSGLVIITLKK